MLERRLLALLLFPFLLAGASLRAEEASPDVAEEWLRVAALVQAENIAAAARAPDPLTAPMAVCEEAACRTWQWHSLSDDEAAELGEAFTGSDDEAEERLRLARAAALFERFMGWRNGTWRDHPGNERLSDEEPGQLDCVAEAINTRTYLTRLVEAGLIRRHAVEGFVHRYALLLQHVAVAIRPDSGDGRFVVDSWVGANGEEPVVEPWSQWRMEWRV